MAEVKTSLGALGVGDGGDNLAVTSGRVQVPQWLFIFLLGQLIGGVWWAASLQSDVRYLQADNVKLWQKVETQELKLGQIDKIVREAVREALEDANYVHVKRKGE